MDSQLTSIPYVTFDLWGPTMIITPFSVRVTYDDGSSMCWKTGYKWSFEVLVERAGIGLYILGQGKPKCVSSIGIDIFGGKKGHSEFIQERLITAIELTEKVEKMCQDYYEGISQSLNK